MIDLLAVAVILIALWVGAAAGLIIAGLCNAAKESDRRIEHYERNHRSRDALHGRR